MRIYECSVNPDGSVTAGSTPVDTKQSSVYNTTEVITSSPLNASKIYMVHIYNDYSYLYEIGFKTPLITSVAGDVNGDGEVTAVDITALYNFLLNNNSSDIVNGDQNGDGEITAGDITFIYNILLGN